MRCLFLASPKLRAPLPVVRSSSMTVLLQRYNTYNWKPDQFISEDDNFMDLTLIVTRSSKLRNGSMACILVKGDDRNETHEFDSSYYFDRIISVATNEALYKSNESDIHAEIAAIGLAARYGYPTLNCTAYITMPPCRKCFAALLCAGVRRIVSRHKSPLIELAQTHNIEMKTLEDWDSHRDRVNATVHAYEEYLETNDTNRALEPS